MRAEFDSPEDERAYEEQIERNKELEGDSPIQSSYIGFSDDRAIGGDLDLTEIWY